MSTALINATPLAPEVALKKALADYEIVLTDEQRDVFRKTSSPQPSDLFNLTAEIERQAENRKSRRYMGPRLLDILQAVQRFSTLVDLVVGGSQSITAGSIWGAVKLALQLATSFGTYLDELSQLFMHIGRSCPRYEEFGILYPRSEGLRKALCEYFAAIVQLCTRTIQFSRKPAFKQFSTTFLKPFKSEFGHCHRDFECLANAVSEELSLASKQAQKDEYRAFGAKFMHDTNMELEESKLWRRKMSKFQLLNKCSTYNYRTAWKQARKCGNAKWITEHERYKEWKEGSDGGGILWCSGIVGSGKTVVSAYLIQDILLFQGDKRTGYFLCRYDEPDSLKARTVIGSIVRQLLSSVGTEAIASTDTSTADVPFDNDELFQLLRGFCKEGDTYFVILDGLDECDKQEFASLTNFVHQLLSSGFTFKIWCSSRPDVLQRVAFDSGVCTLIHMTNANDEIALYIQESLEECIANDDLTLGNPELILTIQNVLLDGAQGMYLWVAFQIKAICAQPNDQSILRTLRRLPKTLPETFDRILKKIDRNDQIEAGFVPTLFALVAAARRPFKLEELREAISIVPGETTWNWSRIPNNMLRYINGCGSLLVLDEENLTVHFAHHSIKEHLCSNFGNPIAMTRTYQVDLEAADARLGEICVTYLNMGIFETQLVRIESSNAKAHNIDYPSAIMAATLPQANLTGKIALALLKRKKGGTKWEVGKQLEKIVTHSKVDSEPQFFFLEYARAFWLQHTKSIEPRGSGIYNLWCRIVNGEVHAVELPWGQREWSEDFIRWVLENNHSALLFYVFKQMPTSETNLKALIRRIFFDQDYQLATQLILSKTLADSQRVPFIFLIIAAGQLRLLRLWIENVLVSLPTISSEELATYSVDCVPLACQMQNDSLKVVEDRDNLWDPLVLAVALNREELVEEITGEYALYHRICEFPDNYVPYFREAACRSLENMMQIMIKTGRILDTDDSHGFTPAFYAAAVDSPSILATLISQGHSKIVRTRPSIDIEKVRHARKSKARGTRRILDRIRAVKEDDIYVPPVYELFGSEAIQESDSREIRIRSRADDLPMGELPKDEESPYELSSSPPLRKPTHEPKKTDMHPRFRMELDDYLNSTGDAYARVDEHASTSKLGGPVTHEDAIDRARDAFSIDKAERDRKDSTGPFAATRPTYLNFKSNFGSHNRQGVPESPTVPRNCAPYPLPMQQSSLHGMFMAPMRYGDLSGVFLTPMTYGTSKPDMASYEPGSNLPSHGTPYRSSSNAAQPHPTHLPPTIPNPFLYLNTACMPSGPNSNSTTCDYSTLQVSTHEKPHSAPYTNFSMNTDEARPSTPPTQTVGEQPMSPCSSSSAPSKIFLPYRPRQTPELWLDSDLTSDSSSSNYPVSPPGQSYHHENKEQPSSPRSTPHESIDFPQGDKQIYEVPPLPPNSVSSEWYTEAEQYSQDNVDGSPVLTPLGVDISSVAYGNWS